MKQEFEIVEEYFGDRLQKVWCFDVPETIKYSLDGIRYTQDEIIRIYIEQERN